MTKFTKSLTSWKISRRENIFSTIFTAVIQAFDKVWHRGWDHKRITLLPKQHAQWLQSIYQFWTQQKLWVQYCTSATFQNIPKIYTEKMNTCIKNWGIQPNENRSVHIDFNNKQNNYLILSTKPRCSMLTPLNIRDVKLHWKVNVKNILPAGKKLQIVYM